MPRSYRAGDSVEDYCRACKLDRMHTVVAADLAGTPIRVVCGYCRSEHNYRGGPHVQPSTGEADAEPLTWPTAAPRSVTEHNQLPIVSERERTAPSRSDRTGALERL